MLCRWSKPRRRQRSTGRYRNYFPTAAVKNRFVFYNALFCPVYNPVFFCSVKFKRENIFIPKVVGRTMFRFTMSFQMRSIIIICIVAIILFWNLYYAVRIIHNLFFCLNFLMPVLFCHDRLLNYGYTKLAYVR